MIVFKHLRVVIVLLIGGPGPTLVCAFRSNTYTASGNNPSTVTIGMLDMLSLKLLILVVLNCIEYCVMIPLEVNGGLHSKVTELELMVTISRN